MVPDIGSTGWSSEKLASGLNTMFIPRVPQPEYCPRTTDEVSNLGVTMEENISVSVSTQVGFHASAPTFTWRR